MQEKKIEQEERVVEEVEFIPVSEKERVVEETAFVPVHETPLAAQPSPKVVVQRLADAVNTLMDVLKNKSPEARKAWIVQIEGKDYFTLLSLQFIGAFFGLAAGVDRYEEVRDENGHCIGYRCHARVVDAHGRIWSEAWGEASRKEVVPEYVRDSAGRLRRTDNFVPRWGPNRPDQHVFSMAQTRAMRKALMAMLAPALALYGYGAEAAEDKEEEKEAEELRIHPVTPRDWAWFWSQVRKLKVSADQVHEYFGVKSLIEIVQTRSQLENALTAIQEAVEKGEIVPAGKTAGSETPPKEKDKLL